MIFGALKMAILLISFVSLIAHVRIFLMGSSAFGNWPDMVYSGFALERSYKSSVVTFGIKVLSRKSILF